MTHARERCRSPVLNLARDDGHLAGASASHTPGIAGSRPHCRPSAPQTVSGLDQFLSNFRHRAGNGLLHTASNPAIPLHTDEWDPYTPSRHRNPDSIGSGLWLALRVWEWKRYFVDLCQPLNVLTLRSRRGSNARRVRLVAEFERCLFCARRTIEHRCRILVRLSARHWRVGCPSFQRSHKQ